MATKNDNPEVQVPEEVPASQEVQEPVNVQELQETKYSKEELMAAAKAAFKVNPEVVMAAMKMANVTEATKAEAEAIIKKFNEKEVK